MDLTKSVPKSTAPAKKKTPAAKKAAPKPSNQTSSKSPKAIITKAPGASTPPAEVTPTEAYQSVPGDAKGAIITAIAITSGSALIAKIVKKDASPHDYMKIILGGFLMGAGLTGISMVNPQLARAIGWVAAISALLINGNAVFGATTNVLDTSKSTAAVAANTAAAVALAKKQAPGTTVINTSTGASKTQKGTP